MLKEAFRAHTASFSPGVELWTSDTMRQGTKNIEKFINEELIFRIIFVSRNFFIK